MIYYMIKRALSKSVSNTAHNVVVKNIHVIIDICLLLKE